MHQRGRGKGSETERQAGRGSGEKEGQRRVSGFVIERESVEDGEAETAAE